MYHPLCRHKTCMSSQPMCKWRPLNKEERRRLCNNQRQKGDKRNPTLTFRRVIRHRDKDDQEDLQVLQRGRDHLLILLQMMPMRGTRRIRRREERGLQLLLLHHQSHPLQLLSLLLMRAPTLTRVSTRRGVNGRVMSHGRKHKN